MRRFDVYHTSVPYNRVGWASVAPMTTKGHTYPTRIGCEFQGKQGQVVLDQIRTVDRARLVKRLGRLDDATQEQVLAGLAELFAP